MSDGAASFRPEGRVTLETLMDLRTRGEAAIAEAGESVVFDLSGIDNGNSAGVALLIAWFREAERLEKRIEFRGVPKDLRDIIGLSGLTDVLPIAEGRSDGAAAGVSL